MKVTVHEHFRLRPGMRIKMTEGPARVLRVTECAAVCQLERAKEREFQPVSQDKPVKLKTQGAVFRISANSEVEIL